MKCQFLRGLAPCGLLPLAVSAAHCQITAYDTVVPNQFQFTSSQYFASRGTTNAFISVDFSPGHRGYYGSVDYATRDGTAIAHQDYVPVSGTLSFSGPARPVLTVPLIAGPQDERKTILLALTPSSFDSGATITRSNAVLHINLPPPPDLGIISQTNGTVVIWWQDDGTDAFLERLITASGTGWSILYYVPVDGKGTRFYTDAPTGGMTLYRLRRPQ